MMAAPHGDLACDDIGVYMDFSSQPIGILEFTYNTYLGLPYRVFQGRNVKISDGKKILLECQYTAISIYVVGSKLQTYATRPNGSMGRSRRLLHVPKTNEV